MIAMSKEAPSSQNQEGAFILMEKCYGLVRADLNIFRGLPFLKSKWPYLFETRVCAAHFKRLMGVDAYESVRSFAAKKADMVMNFLKTYTKESAIPGIIKIENEAKLAWRTESGNDSPSTSCKLLIVLMSLPTYFAETVSDNIVFHKKVTI